MTLLVIYDVEMDRWGVGGPFLVCESWDRSVVCSGALPSLSCVGEGLCGRRLRLENDMMVAMLEARTHLRRKDGKESPGPAMPGLLWILFCSFLVLLCPHASATVHGASFDSLPIVDTSNDPHELDIERRMFGMDHVEAHKRQASVVDDGVPSAPRLPPRHMIRQEATFQNYGPSTDPAERMSRILRFNRIKATIRGMATAKPGESTNAEIKGLGVNTDSLAHASRPWMYDAYKAQNEKCKNSKPCKKSYNVEKGATRCITTGAGRSKFERSCDDVEKKFQELEKSKDVVLLKGKTMAFNIERCYYPSIDTMGPSNGFLSKTFLGSDFITGGMKQNFWWFVMHKRGKYRAICPVMFKKFIGFEAQRSCSEKICSDCLNHVVGCKSIKATPDPNWSRSKMDVNKNFGKLSKGRRGYAMGSVLLKKAVASASTYQVEEIVRTRPVTMCSAIKAWTCASQLKACPMGGHLTNWVLNHGWQDVPSINYNRAKSTVKSAADSLSENQMRFLDNLDVSDQVSKYCEGTLRSGVKLTGGGMKSDSFNKDDRKSCEVFPKDKNIGVKDFQYDKSKASRTGDCKGWNPSAPEKQVMRFDQEWYHYTCFINRLNSEGEDIQQLPVVMGDYERCRTVQALYTYSYKTSKKKLEEDAVKLLCNILDGGNEEYSAKDKVIALFNPWGEKPVPLLKDKVCDKTNPMSSDIKFKVMECGIEGPSFDVANTQSVTISGRCTALTGYLCQELADGSRDTTRVRAASVSAGAQLSKKGACLKAGVDIISAQKKIETKCGHTYQGGAGLSFGVGAGIQIAGKVMCQPDASGQPKPQKPTIEIDSPDCFGVAFKLGLSINLAYCYKSPWERIFAAPRKNSQRERACVKYWEDIGDRDVDFCSYSFWSEWKP